MNVPTIEDVLLRAHVLIDTEVGTIETTKKRIYLGNKAMIVELLLHLTLSRLSTRQPKCRFF